MPDIIINDKVKQAHFDEEEIIVGPNDDENLAILYLQMDCHVQSTNVLWQNANHDRQMHYDNTITADENVIQKVKKI